CVAGKTFYEVWPGEEILTPRAIYVTGRPYKNRYGWWIPTRSTYKTHESLQTLGIVQGLAASGRKTFTSARRAQQFCKAMQNSSWHNQYRIALQERREDYAYYDYDYDYPTP